MIKEGTLSLDKIAAICNLTVEEVKIKKIKKIEKEKWLYVGDASYNEIRT